MRAADADDLPDGWACVKLGAGVISDVQPGFACGAHNRQGDGVAHLRPMNISPDGQIELSDVKYVSASEVDRNERWVTSGDVLFNNTNSPELVGKTAYYSDVTPRAFSNHMTRIRCHAEFLDPRFCAIVLHHKWQMGYFQAVCNNHVSQASISRTVLLDTEIPLPPITEQRRIVEKVEALLTRVQAIRRRLIRVPLILRHFRQATLTAACNGQLTASWCENVRPDPFYTTVEQIAKDHSADIPAIVAEPEPNEGWVRTTLGFLAQPTLQNRPYVTSGSRGWAKLIGRFGPYFIRSENINTDHLHLDDVVRVAAPDGAEADRTRIQPGDLLLTITGNNVGRTARVPQGCPPAHVSQHVAIVRMHPSVLTDFVWLWMRSPAHGQKQLESSFYGETKPGLNLEQIKSVWVDLPPLAEQHEIVRRVDVLFKLADAIERRVAVATARVDRLNRAILAKAFRGELVATDANLADAEGRGYETAERLLARLQQTIAVVQQRKKPTKKTKPTTSRSMKERIRKWVSETEHEYFDFERLQREVAGDYDKIKAAVFSLLDEASLIEQVLDDKSKAICFRRRTT